MSVKQYCSWYHFDFVRYQPTPSRTTDALPTMRRFMLHLNIVLFVILIRSYLCKTRNKKKNAPINIRDKKLCKTKSLHWTKQCLISWCVECISALDTHTNDQHFCVGVLKWPLLKIKKKSLDIFIHTNDENFYFICNSTLILIVFQYIWDLFIFLR